MRLSLSEARANEQTACAKLAETCAELADARSAEHLASTKLADMRSELSEAQRRSDAATSADSPPPPVVRLQLERTASLVEACRTDEDILRTQITAEVCAELASGDCGIVVLVSQ